jgi:hypothetical protein
MLCVEARDNTFLIIMYVRATSNNYKRWTAKSKFNVGDTVSPISRKFLTIIINKECARSSLIIIATYTQQYFSEQVDIYERIFPQPLTHSNCFKGRDFTLFGNLSRVPDAAKLKHEHVCKQLPETVLYVCERTSCLFFIVARNNAHPAAHGIFMQTHTRARRPLSGVLPPQRLINPLPSRSLRGWVSQI